MDCALRIRGGAPKQPRAFDSLEDYISLVRTYSERGLYPMEVERAHDPADYTTAGVLKRTWHKKRDTCEQEFPLGVLLQSPTSMGRRILNAAMRSKKRLKVARLAAIAAVAPTVPTGEVEEPAANAAVALAVPTEEVEEPAAAIACRPLHPQPPLYLSHRIPSRPIVSRRHFQRTHRRTSGIALEVQLVRQVQQPKR